MLFFIAAAAMQQSFFANLFPRPTGLNGYEDYVRACDVLQDGDYLKAEGWLNDLRKGGKSNLKLGKKQVEAQSYLEGQKLVVKNFSGVLDLIETGNSKPVTDPRTDYDVVTTFPELSHFKSAAKLEAHAAYVSFAEGNTSQGVRRLLSEMMFAHNISPGLIINRLVAVACESIGLAELERHLAQLSLADAREVDQFAVAELNMPPAGVNCLQSEQAMMLKALRSIQDVPRLDVEQNADMEKQFASLSNLEKKQLADQVASKMVQDFQQARDVLMGPESQWKTLMADKESPRPSLVQYLSDTMGTGTICDALVRVEGIKRTQWRLLHLNAKVLEYRWLNGDLPAALADCVDSKEAVDPLSGEPFVYKLQGKTYELFSVGFASMGEIRLKYTAPKSASSDADSSPTNP